MLIKSYRTALITLFVMTLVFTVIGVLINTYTRTTQAMLAFSGGVTHEIADKIIQRTTTLFHEAEIHLQVNSKVSLLEKQNIIAAQDQWLAVFWQQLQLSPYVASIYIADTKGNFVQARRDPRLATRVIDHRPDQQQNESWIYRDQNYQKLAHVNKASDYDPRQRPWFKQSSQKTQPHWSSVYRFHGTGETGITVSMPYLNAQGQIVAILGVDITLNVLSTFLSQQYFGKEDIAALINGKNELIAYPLRLEFQTKQATPLSQSSQSLAFPKLDEQVTQQWFVQAWLSYQQQRKNTLPPHDINNDADNTVFAYEGRHYVATTVDLPAITGQDWKLLIAAPEDDLLGTVKRSLQETFVISLIILIVFMVIMSLATIPFFTPVLRLARNTRLINEHRLNEVQPVSSPFREIRQMDSALQQMKTGLETFCKYAPTQVIQHFMAHNETIAIGGEEREMILFSAGIQHIEKLYRQTDSTEVVNSLSAYLHEFSDVIVKEQGTIDQHVGDVLSAFWGAPTLQSDAAIRACYAALSCVEAKNKLQQHWRHTDQTVLEPQISLHASQAIVGHLGSETRLQYTVLGEAVKLNNQLLSLNTYYGVDILLSHFVYKQVKAVFHCRLLDCIKTDSSDEPLRLYALLAKKETALAHDIALFVERYQQAFHYYAQQAWAKAIDSLIALQHDYPYDKSTQLLLARCQSFQQHQPWGKAWDGSVSLVDITTEMKG